MEEESDNERDSNWKGKFDEKILNFIISIK